MEQGSEEWLKWRMSGIGASEIASILGLCPYGGTPYKVWQVKTGRSKGFEGNSFTEHGKEMEAKARARYELTNMDDLPPAVATHPEFPFLIASLDGWSKTSKKVLEIKCPKGLSTLECAEGGEVIHHYRPQVQHQLLVTGADELDFFVFHEETKREALVTVNPDLQMQALIQREGYKFWHNYVLVDVPPPLTDQDVKVIAGNLEISAICELIKAGRDKLKKPMLDQLKADAVRLGGHPKIKCDGVQISTVNRSGKFSYHKLTIEEGT